MDVAAEAARRFFVARHLLAPARSVGGGAQGVLEVVRRLAAGSQAAIAHTKLALNSWLRAAGPAFDASLALEFLDMTGPDVVEGVAAVRERRAPKF